ncbi:MAG: hypothetical protein PVG32_00610 [Anaerolineales bacterium]|jgi:hypothetical protein
MLDDLRKEGGEMSFMDEEEPTPDFEETPEDRQLFLGMTPVQRFVIAVMLLFIICILSAFCLLVTERVLPPQLF